jgi:hypothetical protein
MDWNMIGAIATAFMATVVLAAAIIAVWQLLEMRGARKLSAFTNLIQSLQREEIRKARRTLLKDLSRKKNFNSWTEDEIMKAEMVCHTYDTAGLMVSKKHIDGKLVAVEWHNSIVRCWEAAEPMITRYKWERGDDFFRHFEKLYEMAQEYESAIKQGDAGGEDG